MIACTTCGSEDLRPYSVTPPPPRGQKPSDQHGVICFACKMFTPNPESKQ